MARYVQLDCTYWKSDTKVFCERRPLKLDPETVCVYFGAWATDGNRVYCGPHLIRRADAATFVGLNPLYAKDAENCYACPAGLNDLKTVSKADPTTFEVLDSGEEYSCSIDTNLTAGFARDANRVYYNGNAIKSADRSTFVSLGHCFARDSQQVYFERTRLPQANPMRWRRLHGHYSCDDSNVFWQCKRVPTNCPSYQFVVIPHSEADLGYDGERFFCEGEICDLRDAINYLEQQAASVSEFASIIKSGKWQSVLRDSHRSYRAPDEREFDAQDLQMKESRSSLEERIGPGEDLPLAEFVEWFEPEEDDFNRPDANDDLVRWDRGPHTLVAWFGRYGLRDFRIRNAG